MSTLPMAQRTGRQPSACARWAILLIGFALGFFVSCSGLTGHGEKQIRYELTHRFAIEDPQFLRSMGQLLGPAILPGNQVTALQNGDQIFRPCSSRFGAPTNRSRSKPTSIGPVTSAGNSRRPWCERALAGVKVHVCWTGLGAEKINGKYLGGQ